MDYGNTLRLLDFFSDGTFTFYAVECIGWKLVRIVFIIGQSCVYAWESCAYISMICIYLLIYVFIHLLIYLFIYMHTCICIYSIYSYHLYNIYLQSSTCARRNSQVSISFFEETTGCTEGGTVSASWSRKNGQPCGILLKVQKS